MLVLTRREGEEIIIGDDIVLTVISIQRDKIRLGIKAPKHVRVDRQEVSIQRQERTNNTTPESLPTSDHSTPMIAPLSGIISPILPVIV